MTLGKRQGREAEIHPSPSDGCLQPSPALHLGSGENVLLTHSHLGGSWRSGLYLSPIAYTVPGTSSLKIGTLIGKYLNGAPYLTITFSTRPLQPYGLPDYLWGLPQQTS